MSEIARTLLWSVCDSPLTFRTSENVTEAFRESPWFWRTGHEEIKDFSRWYLFQFHSFTNDFLWILELNNHYRELFNRRNFQVEIELRASPDVGLGTR